MTARALSHGSSWAGSDATIQSKAVPCGVDGASSVTAGVTVDKMLKKASSRLNPLHWNWPSSSVTIGVGGDGGDGRLGVVGEDGGVGLPGITDGEDGTVGGDGDVGDDGPVGLDGTEGVDGAEGADGPDGAPAGGGPAGMDMLMLPPP
jgi:hypothetical protein